MKQIFYFLLILGIVYGGDLDFNLIKKGKDNNNTVLIVGGIQGDEPGGFMAANLLAMDYEIIEGSVWVVPNLNFDSIIKRNRGINGDLNRKFAELDSSDPEFQTVQRIKKIISSKNVSLIVHLHDGSGFYRTEYLNEMENPKRWGNSCIIDEEKLEGAVYGNLAKIAQSVADEINKHIDNPKYLYSVKNTRTEQGDQEMSKSLTYFAFKNKKAAFANEASKTFGVAQRVYYHLLAIEHYLKIAGVKFKRNFDLSISGVEKAIDKEIEVLISDNKFYLSLKDPRKNLNYIPISSDKKISYTTNNNLAALVKNKEYFEVYYGNKLLTKLSPQYFQYSDTIKYTTVEVDGVDQNVSFGTKVKANQSIKIHSKNKVRVNVIGYSGKNKNEFGVKISKEMIDRKFSIDKDGKIFRVEFYEQQKNGKDKYLGMFLLEFAFLQGFKEVA